MYHKNLGRLRYFCHFSIKEHFDSGVEQHKIQSGETLKTLRVRSSVIMLPSNATIINQNYMCAICFSARVTEKLIDSFFSYCTTILRESLALLE